ncbi:hypothetical protein MaudCBS49596_002035 [Microsporum audouinii]
MADAPQSPSKRQIGPDQGLCSSSKRSRLETGTWALRNESQLSESNSDHRNSGINSATKEPELATRSEIASKGSSPELSDSDPTSPSASSGDSDSESEYESSDEEPSDDDEQMHNQTIHIPSRPSANIPNNSALRARLASFIPSLKAANENLEREIAAGKTMTLEVDNADEGKGQYIEMNLGLGVLQEGEDDHISEGSESSDCAEKNTNQEKNIIDKLMGKKPVPRKPNIEEVDS